MSKVIIYDSDLNKVAYLPDAFDIAYELRANEVGKASFSIAVDDAHVSEITQRRYAEIYDGDRRIELFRIVRLTKTGHTLKVECEHVLATLADTEIDDTLYGSAGTATAIGEVLAEQAHWQLGTCDFDEQFLYEWPRGTSLLKALLDIPKRFQAGYFWTFDTTSHPWTINLVTPPTVVRAYIDYGRNMQSIEREEDVTDLVTKLYPHGAKAGADQIGITSVEPSGNPYITNYTYTSEVITRHWTDQNYVTEQELYDAAVELLARVSRPKYTYRVNAADIYKITGESIDRFEIGTLVKVSNPEADIDADVRVMSITKSDLTGKPGDITLELANKGEEFDFSEKVNVNDLSGIDINDIPGGTPGALPGPLVGTGLTITTDYLGYHVESDWKTYMDIAGRLWADAGANAYFHFDPTVPSLEIKMTGGDSYDDIQQALADAATAQAAADGQLVGFYQDTAPTSGMYYGDIWIDTDGADPLDTTCIYRYQDASGGYTEGAMSWEHAPDNAVGRAYLDAAGAQSTADGKIVTFYQTSQPTAEGVGDLWVDTDDEYKVYRWSGSAWDAVTGAVAHLNILTDAYIQSLSFDKITAATNTASLTIGGSGYLQSSNYSSGSAGFRISGNGDAEFNDVTVRGALIAESGSSLNGAYIQNATIVDAKLSGTISASRIAAGSITTEKLYIDDDVQFKVGGTYNKILGCDAIYHHDSPDDYQSEPYVALFGDAVTISAGTSGRTYIKGPAYLYVSSYNGEMVLDAGQNIKIQSGSAYSVSIVSKGDTIEILDIGTSGGQWALGYINVKLNGVLRSIAIENPH